MTDRLSSSCIYITVDSPEIYIVSCFPVFWISSPVLCYCVYILSLSISRPTKVIYCMNVLLNVVNAQRGTQAREKVMQFRGSGRSIRSVIVTYMDNIRKCTENSGSCLHVDGRRCYSAVACILECGSLQCWKASRALNL